MGATVTTNPTTIHILVCNNTTRYFTLQTDILRGLRFADLTLLLDNSADSRDGSTDGSPSISRPLFALQPQSLSAALGDLRLPTTNTKRRRKRQTASFRELLG